jgi:hypothetical protein
MKKIWIPAILLSTAAAIILAFFAAVKQIEKRILSSGIISSEAELIQEKAGLSLKYARASYDIFRGLVLTGAVITERTEKQENLVFSSGEAIFTFPLMNLISGSVEPSQLIFKEGHIHLSGNDPRKRIERLIGFLKHTSLDLEWQNLQIDGLKHRSDFGVKDVRLAGTILVRSRETPVLHLAVRFRGDAVFTLQGSWKSSARERLFLSVKGMPAQLPELWLKGLPLLPADADLILKTGWFNADGSIDLTEEGYAVHLRGDFKQVHFSIPDAGIEARDLDGSFHQMIVGSYAAGMLHSRFRVSHPLFDHSAELDKDRKTGVDEARFTGKLNLRESKHLKLPRSVRSADIEYAVTISTGKRGDRELLTPDVKITIRELVLDPGEQWKSLSPVRIKEATVVGSNPIAVYVPGSTGSVPFQFTATIQPDLYKTASDGIIFKHQSEFQLSFDELSIEDTVHRTAAFVDDLRRFVSSPDAVKSEDFGPVWENKFIRNPVFRKYLEPASIKGVIYIRKISDASADMPSSLQFQFRHQVPSSELTLIRPAGFDMNAHYRIFYDANLPSHDARFEVNYSGQSYRSRLFVDPQMNVDPLESLEFKYTFQAEGLYPADLYYKSLTGLFIKARHVAVQKDYRLDLLLRMMELQTGGLRYVNFDVQRHSSGSLFKPLIIKIDGDEGSLTGNGEFNLYEGGLLEFNYFLKSTGRQGRFNIRIRPDQVWIPSS